MPTHSLSRRRHVKRSQYLVRLLKKLLKVNSENQKRKNKFNKNKTTKFTRYILVIFEYIYENF